MAQTNYYYAKNIRRYKGMTFINLLLNCIQDIAVYAVLIYRVLTAAITIGNFTMYLNAINKCLLIKQLSVTSNSYICSGHTRIGTDAKEHKVFASES